MSHQISLETSPALLLLVEEMSKGEEIVFTKDNQPVAKLVAFTNTKEAPAQREPIQPGSGKGWILHIADDFDAPLEDFKEYM